MAMFNVLIVRAKLKNVAKKEAVSKVILLKI